MWGQTAINASVKVSVESGSIKAWNDRDSYGILSICLSAKVDFQGSNLKGIMDRFKVIDPEKVQSATATAVSSALKELLEQDISEGKYMLRSEFKGLEDFGK